jgi:hypothetical protein
MLPTAATMRFFALLHISGPYEFKTYCDPLGLSARSLGDKYFNCIVSAARKHKSRIFFGILALEFFVVFGSLKGSSPSHHGGRRVLLATPHQDDLAAVSVRRRPIHTPYINAPRQLDPNPSTVSSPARPPHLNLR